MKPFLTVDKSLKDMATTKNQEHVPFGGKHIILTGDPAQLPAVEQDIFYTFLWKKCEIVILKDIKRQQDDDTFPKIRSTVRMGKNTNEIKSAPKSKVLYKSQTTQTDLDTPGTAIICILRRERDAWTQIFLHKVDNDLHTFEAEDTDKIGNPLVSHQMVPPRTTRRYM